MIVTSSYPWALAVGSKLVALGLSLTGSLALVEREDSVFCWFFWVVEEGSLDSGGADWSTGERRSEGDLDFLEVLVATLSRSSSGPAPPDEEEVEPAVLSPVLFSTEWLDAELAAKIRLRASR
jgi:hypothetical protein